MEKFVWLMLALMGVVFLGTGLALALPRPEGQNAYIRTQAVVCANAPSDAFNSVEPIVEFMDDGRLGRHGCAAVSRSAYSAKPGDTIDVLYRKKQVLGMTTWTVLVDTGDDPALARGNAHRLFGWIFAGAGIILLAVGLMIKLFVH